MASKAVCGAIATEYGANIDVNDRGTRGQHPDGNGGIEVFFVIMQELCKDR